MIRFILLTLAVLAWAFWILSDGSDFEPELRADPAPAPVAPQPDPTPAPEPEPVAVADPTPPAATEPAAAPQADPQPEPEPQPTVPGAQDPALTEALSTALATPEPTPEPAPAPAPERPALDLRLIDATRVNMRSGPSTDYRVLDTLTRGTSVEVKEIDISGEEPWARILVLSTGLEGWMAERFLAAQ